MFWLTVAVVLGTSSAIEIKDTLVYPKLIESRSDTGEHVLKLTDTLTLNLRPSNVLADNIEYAEDDLVEEMDTENLRKNLLVDPRQMSSVLLHDTEGGLKVEGILHNSYFIRPTRLAARSSDGQDAHLISRISGTSTLLPNYASEIPENYESVPDIESRTSDCKEGEEPPEDITFEVYVISDKEHQKYFPKRRCLIMYTALLFNSVNYYLRSMTKPRVQLRITGVRRIRGRESNYLKTVDAALDGNVTLHTLKERSKTLNLGRKADLALLLTGRNIAPDEKRKNQDYLHGLAFANGLCTENFVAVSTDNPPGFYRGTAPAFRVLGFLLGSRPKGGKNPAKGKTDACSRTESDKVIFANYTRATYKFSKCNEKLVRETIKEKGCSCWAVNTRLTVGRSYTYYPGQNLTREKYCKRKFAHEATNVYVDQKDADKCKVTCCLGQTANTAPSCYTAPAVDGMSCKDNKMCLGGKCTLPPQGSRTPGKTEQPQ
ncbi:uncharacterized protein LOC135399246 [Ornithodoros turicata]|uniref:uncharacterized protein LOC135399246 n=1 Tax=Ornithodoros turicata TaxID=34597 RepID=UPI003138F4CF